MRKIKVLLQADGRPTELTWSCDRAELLADGVVHAIGLGLALVGAVILIMASRRSTHGLETASILVYAASLLAMLGFSAAYNMWPVSSEKWTLRRFDHSAIYLLIAATYTLFIGHLKSGMSTVALCAGIWLVAIIGILLKLTLPGRLDHLSIGLYLLLGWSGVIAYEPVVAALPNSTLWLIAAGGILYSAGVIFHVWDKLRFHNAIWHSFVLVAAMCHWTAALDCVALARM